VGFLLLCREEFCQKVGCAPVGVPGACSSVFQEEVMLAAFIHIENDGLSKLPGLRLQRPGD
jgi:hypothetical protein